MIEEHTDPTAEAHAQASNLLRTLLTALATVADRRAQRRQADQEHQRQQSEAERRELEKRIEAERESSYLVYRRVYDESWWASPSPRKVADAVVAAGTWARDDPRARDAWAELSEQLQARYGIDLDALARQHAGTDGPLEQVATGVRGQVERAQEGGIQTELAGASTRSESTTGQAAPSARRWEAEVVGSRGRRAWCPDHRRRGLVPPPERPRQVPGGWRGPLGAPIRSHCRGRARDRQRQVSCAHQPYEPPRPLPRPAGPPPWEARPAARG
jgi:hypothetical protein